MDKNTSAKLAVSMEKDIENPQDEKRDEEGLRNRKILSLERNVFSEPELEDDYDGGPRRLKSVSERFAMIRQRNACSGSCIKEFLVSLFPFIGIMRKYNLKTDLINDVIAGLTVGIMQIPQGMAYAVLASVEAVIGLYMSFFPIIIYFFFGTSKHLSFGTFAVIGLMVGGAVDSICGEEEEELAAGMAGLRDGDNSSLNGTDSGDTISCALGVSTAITFIGGLMQIAMGVLHLGFVVIYLSEPMTRGFTTGASIHVFSSQIKSIFGVEIPRHSGLFKLIYTYRDLVLALPETNPAAVLSTIICCAVIFVVKEYANPPFKKKFRAPIPIDLVIVILGTVASYYMGMEEKYGLEVIGEVPTGIPPPRLPPLKYFSSVVVDALVISVVSFAISISMAELFAKRNNYKTDANQELIAHGITNFVCSNLNCYMMSVSLSRSLVQENVGGVTQIAGLVSSVLILVVLLALASLFEALPTCILAAIIVVALKGMFMQVLDIPKLWRISKTDLSVWLITFLAVVFLDIDFGLLVGVAWSFLTVVGRTHRPYCTVLGQVGDTEVYVDTNAYKQAKEIPGVKIFRCENSVYFANREYFIERVYHKAKCNPKQLKQAQKKAQNARNKQEIKLRLELDEEETKRRLDEGWPVPQSPVHHVIIDCSGMSYLDAMGVGGMTTIITEYKQVGVTVCLAACKPGVMETLQCSGFHENIPRSCLFPTIHDAVMCALKDRAVESTKISIEGYANEKPLSLMSDPSENGNVVYVSETPTIAPMSEELSGIANPGFHVVDKEEDELTRL